MGRTAAGRADGGNPRAGGAGSRRARPRRSTPRAHRIIRQALSQPRRYAQRHTTPRARATVRRVVRNPQRYAPPRGPAPNVFRRRIDSPLRSAVRDAATRTLIASGDIERASNQRGTARSVNAQARLLWSLAKRSYGGAMPRTRVRPDPSWFDAAGYVFDSRPKTANIPVSFARPAAGVNPYARTVLQKVLLHEWAHNRQPLSSNRPRAEIEGGAEAFARDLARKLGLGNVAGTYPDEVRRVRARHSGAWISGGQFK